MTQERLTNQVKVEGSEIISEEYLGAKLDAQNGNLRS